PLADEPSTASAVEESPAPASADPASGEWRVRIDEPTSAPSQHDTGNIEVVRFDSAESNTPSSQGSPSPATSAPAATAVGPSAEQPPPSAGVAPAEPTANFAAQLDMLE